MDGFAEGLAAGLDSRNSNTNGFNDGNIFWWVIVFALIFGWGRGGFGYGGGEGGTALNGALTRGDLCMDMSFQDVKSSVRNIEDSVNLGFSNLNSTICNQQYDTARMINNLGTSVLQGFNQTNITNLQGFNGVQSQLASCCCDIERGIDSVNYNMATNTGAIINAGNSNTQRILDYLCNQELERKNEKIASLQADKVQLENTINQQAQSSYIISALAPKQPIPAYPVFPTTSFAYPTGVTFGVNPYSNGCGCNSGCGCGSAL